MATPRAHLDEMIKRFSPEIAGLGRAALKQVRKLIPGAVELIYDNTYALVVGFGATDRASEAVLSVAIFPKKVALCFLWGGTLADPDKRLRGSGKQVRNIRVESGADLDDPAVQRLIRAAAAASESPFNVRAKRRMEVRAIAPKRRPRRVGPDGRLAPERRRRKPPARKRART